MKIQIEPINFPFIGIATELNVVVLSFDTQSTTCTTNNQLLTDDGVICLSWKYTLTEEEYSNWGQNNSYIENIVANKKGIVIINP
jgi:hypothetical protein